MNAAFEHAQQFTALWMELATKMGLAAMAFRPDQPPPQASRSVRDATFTAIEQQADKYLRSPQFLQAMKQSLDASIATRKQMNEALTQIHHSVQAVAKQDVESLSQSVRQLENRVLDRVEQLISKIDALHERIEAIESAQAGQNGRGGAVIADRSST